MRMNSAALVALVVCLPLAGCGKKAPTGQVEARVDGKEITVQEIRAEMAGVNTPDVKIRKLAEQQALQSIVNRKLLASAAEKAGIAKTPDFAIEKQRMEEGLLVQAWQNGLVKAVPEPAPEEVQRFITEHPEFYSDHKVFVIDQLRIPPINDPKTLAELQPLKTLEEVSQALAAHGIRAAASKATVDALAIPPQLLAQIEKLPPGEVFVLPSNGVLTANRIIDTKTEPLPADIANKHAVRYIKNERAQEAVRRQFGSAIQQGASKVQYNPVYAPPKQPAPAAKGAGGAKPAAAPAAVAQPAK